MTRLKTLAAAGLALVLIAVGVLVSTGGEDDSDSGGSGPARSEEFETPGSGSSPSDDLGALPPGFVECMSEQGYEIASAADMHSAPPAVLQTCFGASH